MANRIKVGVLGTGTVAELYYLSAVAGYSEKAELTAVCDVVPGRAEAAAQKYGAAQSYDDYSAMLAEADLDAVLVLTQHQFHYENTKQALLAGKHVAVEKPLSNRFDEARELVELAEARGLKLSCAPPMFFEPLTIRVRELIQGGAIGKVAYAVSRASGSGPARRVGWGSTDQTWFYQAGGGPLASLGAYNLTTLTWILGPVKRVGALTGISIPQRFALSGPEKGQTFETTAPDNNLLLLDWGDNLFGMTDIGYCAIANKSPRAEYYGDEGVLIVNGGSGRDCIEVYEQHEDLGYAGWVPAGSPNLGANFDISVTITHLIDCLLDGTEPVTSGRHALHVTEIMDLAEKSSELGTFRDTTTSI